MKKTPLKLKKRDKNFKNVKKRFLNICALHGPSSAATQRMMGCSPTGVCECSRLTDFAAYLERLFAKCRRN